MRKRVIFIIMLSLLFTITTNVLAGDSACLTCHTDEARLDKLVPIEKKDSGGASG